MVLAVLALVQSVVPSTGSIPPIRFVAQPSTASAPVRILPLGASITYGYEHGSYRAPLWDMLAAGGYEIDFVGSMSDGPSTLPDRDHEGHRGWGITQITEHAGDWVAQHDPDIVLLHIGTNDLRQGASPQEAANRMDTLLETLTSAKPELTVIVSTLIPISEGGAGDPGWQQTNNELARVVERRAAAGAQVMLADMARGGPQAGDQIPDGVHPNAEGYARMAEVWYPVVVDAIAHDPPTDGGGRTPPDGAGPQAGSSRCLWYAAAKQLARSIAGVTDPRASDIRAELTSLGITPDSEPPAACRTDDTGQNTGEEGAPGREPRDDPDPAGSTPARDEGGIGRIALSADGNQHDEDDWASSAMGLAILAKRGLQSNVVHYSYNDHIWDSAPEHRQNMTASAMGAGERFRFDTSRFYDAADPSELAAGVANLTAEINASTADHELWLVLAGPMEVAWMALDAADPAARQHVKCVSHGEWNETHAAADHGGHTYEDLVNLGCQRFQIPDQNSNLGETEMSDWAYLRNGDDPAMDWLYSRIELHGDGDVSDAGMNYHVITGDESVTREELRAFLQG